MSRELGRGDDQLRAIHFDLGYSRWAEGSVLARFGETHVLCNVTVEDKLPGWIKNSDRNHGWLTAEYAMLPRSTNRRIPREQRWPKGRTQEISRLIGRSLRMAVDLDQLGERTVTVDCDVLQADGGTRTAAISGGWVALQLALRPLVADGLAGGSLMERQIAAISVGLVAGRPLLDLAYVEDVAADVDLNVVMTGAGQWVEVQGTAEKQPMDRAQFDELLNLATRGIEQVLVRQNEALNAA